MTNDDAEYVNDRWHDYTRRVRDLQVLTNKTKHQIIQEGAELTALKIEYKLLNIKKAEISSYLFKELNHLVGSDLEEPEFQRRYIQMTIPAEFKQEKELYEIVSHVDRDWKEIEVIDCSFILEKDQYNDIRINGIEYVPRSEPRNKENSQDIIKIEEKDTKHNDWLKLASKIANKFHLTLDKLIEEYNKSDKTQKIIEGEIKDIDKKLESYVLQWADIDTNKNIIDDRRAYGEYEKIMAAFMIETGETIARIAQLMDYSEKYGSIGILREKRVLEFFETEDTYPLYLRSCPSCKVDISQIMNRNISIYRKGIELDIELPTIKYH